MKFPFVILFILYAAGLIVADRVSLPLTWLYSISFLVFIASLFHARARGLWLSLLLISIGWTISTTTSAILSPHDLRLLIGDEAKEATIRGQLVRTPEQRFFERDGETKVRSLARINVDSINFRGQWQPAHGEVLTSTSEVLPAHIFGGTQVEITGILHKPKRPIAPGLFDYRTFLRRQGIYYQLDVHTQKEWRVLSPLSKGPPLSDRFLSWGQATLKRGLPEDQSLHLLWAMTLGWKTGLTGEVSEPFMQSGTMHIFAISGLHIALMAGILVAALRAFRVPRGWCLIVIPILWFYTTATGWQPSAVRSTVMMTIVIAGWALKRPGDLLNSLGAAAFIILVFDPHQLFQASFQLSFFVVLSLALLIPPFERVRKQLSKHDPLLPEELIPKWQRVVDIPLRWVSKSFVTSLAAWIGSLPLVAYYFHLITPISLLANIVVVPLASLALMCNLGSLLCGWIPGVAELFNHSGWLFMQAMVWSSNCFAQSPGAYFYIREPSLIESILFYVVAFAVFTYSLFGANRWRWTTPMLVTIASIWLCAWGADNRTWTVTVLPLEGGESIFVDAPGTKEDLLIDCGNESSVQFVTTPFLRAQGVNRLPRLVLTHGDLRNIGGTTNIVSEFEIKQIATSSLRFRSPTYRSIQTWLHASEELHEPLHAGDKCGRWKVLHPSKEDKFSQADDGPLVLRGTINGTTLLFLSDLSRSSQHLLWNRAGKELQADIVVAGLPRESEPLNDALIETIQPKLIIITDSEFPATERSSGKLRERLGKCDVPVIFCRDAGAVTINLTPRGFTFHRGLEPKE